MNKYLLTLKNKIIIQTENGLPEQNFGAVTSLLEEAHRLGYSFDNESIRAMLSLTSKSLRTLYLDTIKTLSEMKGDKGYRPMYQNFPMDVKSATDAELFVNQMVHYVGVYFMGINILPSQPVQAREVLEGDYPNKLIKLGTENDLTELFDNLVKSPVTWNQTQKDFVHDFVLSNRRIKLETLGLFQNKSNKAEMFAIAYHNVNNDIVNYGSAYIDTATDLLRIYTAISGGDVSLMTNTKYVNVPKKVSRAILSKLDDRKFLEDMFRYRAKWLRIGEKIHPMSKLNAKRFSIAAKNFDTLRNGSIKTVMSDFEGLKIKGENLSAMKLLIANNRNGDLVRNFYDLFLKMSESEREEAKTLLANSAKNVSTKVLFDAYTRFASLVDKNDTFFIRGGEKIWKNRGIETKKAKNQDAIRLECSNRVLQELKNHPKYAGHVVNELPDYPKELPYAKRVRNEVRDSEKLEVADVIRKVLVERFSEKDSLGKVYIDDNIRKMFIPFSNATQRTVTPRGSRISVPETRKVVRNFIYWKNMKTGYNTRVDLDLSVVVLNEKFETTQSCWYGNQRSAGLHQSGDITDAPNGASEYIDVEVDKVLAQGGRYVCCTVKSFTGQTFEDIVNNGGEAYGGFMVRDNAETGEIFDARTVAEKVELNSKGINTMISIYDLKNNEYIWVDFNARGNFSGINVANSKLNDSEIAKAFIELKKPTLGSLLDMHAEARGDRVYTREEAEVTFGFEDNDIKPTDVDYILGELLGE